MARNGIRNVYLELEFRAGGVKGAAGGRVKIVKEEKASSEFA
jgi:hypothetical protein